LSPVLFCDLVGFTAASEQADPEDVRARIRPYHARLREVVERHGGTVEKFVGDAVMAVFWAPVAHEDDAERAVRAGLRILEAISELNETRELEAAPPPPIAAAASKAAPSTAVTTALTARVRREPRPVQPPTAWAVFQQ
jgi:class 3 adenylate cyclase